MERRIPEFPQVDVPLEMPHVDLPEIGETTPHPQPSSPQAEADGEASDRPTVGFRP